MPVAAAGAEIESVLEIYLAALAGVAALVGKRISPVRAAMGKELPRIVYQTIEDVPVMTTKGETGTRRTKIHLSCWARNSDEARVLAQEVCGTPTNRRLAGFQGWMPTAVASPKVWVQYAKVSDRMAEQETPAQGDDGGEHRRLLEVTVFWNVPA